MRAASFVALLIGAGCLPGCVIVQTGVTNPLPGMTTVAVAPFINLSAERSVDGRRFALAYHAELQKVPGYQVIPVGVTEQAIVDLGLNLDGPEDALKLAKALGADAVVIGAVTDYTPYYPPRIGLQVSWYAPEPWRFSPGIPTDPELSEAVRAWRFVENATEHRGGGAAGLVLRAQSPDPVALDGRVIQADGVRGANPVQLVGVETADENTGPLLFAPNVVANGLPQVTAATAEEPVKSAEPEKVPEPASPPQTIPVLDALAAAPEKVPAEAVSVIGPCPPGMACPPVISGRMTDPICLPPGAGSAVGPAVRPPLPYDPREPIMSYTRLFDGSDAELTALLRDYVILSGDLRSGGWEAYLHRTEDFVRFTAHRMIVEMLTLHGGESKRRYVWLLHREHH